MVLSEVAERLMMMSGSGASTCGAEYGRAVTSRLTEVTTTTVPAGHRQPGGPDQELMRRDQAGFAWPSRTTCRRPDAVENHGDLPCNGDLRFLHAIRFASFIPQALREDHFFVR